eukprot:5117139-Pleurochrysis_carterae.AAC.7
MNVWPLKLQPESKKCKKHSAGKSPLPGQPAVVQVDMEEVNDPSQQRRRGERNAVRSRGSAAGLRSL